MEFLPGKLHSKMAEEENAGETEEEKCTAGETEGLRWGETEGLKYDTKHSESMIVKTCSDGVAMSAHSAIAVKFRNRVLNVSLLLGEEELATLFDGAAWAGT